MSEVPADSHGCITCAHSCKGKAIKGSPNVYVNSKNALRVTDTGVHAACCGPNNWTASKGSATVFANGLASHRLNDQDTHCGGVGKMIEASDNVVVG